MDLYMKLPTGIKTKYENCKDSQAVEDLEVRSKQVNYGMSSSVTN